MCYKYEVFRNCKKCGSQEKGSSFDNVTNNTAKKIMSRLNNRPRKSLNYMTPNEFLYELTG